MLPDHGESGPHPLRAGPACGAERTAWATLAVVVAAFLVQRTCLGDSRVHLVPWLWGGVAVAGLIVWGQAQRFSPPPIVPDNLETATPTRLRALAFRTMLGFSLAATVVGLAVLYHDLQSALGGWLWLTGLLGVAAALCVREAQTPWLTLGNRTAADWLWWGLAAGVIVTAFATRIYHLETIPATFLQDEASVADWGLNVFHHTPVWGQHVAEPMTLFRTGATAYPLLGSYLYALVMQVAGETVFGARITAAVCGGLTVWIFYALLSAYVRRWAAIAATLLLAFSHQHLFWSRSGMLQSASTLTATLVIWLTLRGLRSPGYLSFVLAGLSLGAAQYLYEGARFLVPILALFFVYMTIAERRFLRERWSHVTVMALIAAAVVAPIGFWYLVHPRELLGRTRDVLVFLQPAYRESRYPGLSAAEVILAQLRRSLAGFAFWGDGSAAFYPVSKPLLDPLAAASVLVGILGFTLRPLRRTDVLIALWIWVPVLIACTVTIDPPPMTRLILMVPALFFLVGVVFDRLGPVLQQVAAQRRLAHLTVPVFLIGLGYAALWNYDVFFVQYPRQVPANVWTEAGNLARTLGPSSKTYMVSPMQLYFYAPEMRFLARGLAGADVPHGGIPVRERGFRDGVFIVSPGLPAALERLRAVYPRGRLQAHRNLRHVLLFTSYRVASADLNEAAGSDAPWLQYDLRFGMRGKDVGQFDQGRALTVDSVGRIYVADGNNGRIDVFDSTGQPIATLGQPGDGDADFGQIVDVAVAPDGSVLGLDRAARLVKRFSQSGAWLGNLGGPAQLKDPAGIAVTANGGILVADRGEHAIYQFTPAGTLTKRIGSPGRGPGEFDRPAAVAVAADGTVYVSDAGNARVQRFSPALAYQGEWSVPPTNLDFGPLVAVADADDGAVYVVDASGGQVNRYSADGRMEWAVGARGGAPDQFILPVAVATDASGNVYVLDAGRNQIYRFDVSRRRR